MELRTLRYFLAVAGEENITKAADILHVTQPTLSRQMIDLEKELGCAFCLDGALAIHSSPRLRFVPVYPEHMTRSVLIWKKKHLFSPAASLFIQEINMLRAQIE